MTADRQLSEIDIESIANLLSSGATLSSFYKSRHYSWIKCDDIFILCQFEKKTDLLNGLRAAQKLANVLKRVFGFVSDQLLAQNFIGVTMVG